MKKVSALVRATCALALSIAALTVQAQAWPTKPLTLVVPYPPGGFADNISRVVAQQLARVLGQSVIVENKAGAGGRIGTDFALQAPKDGYTLSLGVPATLSLLPIIDPKYANLASQYTPITVAVRTYLGLAVNPDKTAARNFRDFAAFARANPGKVAYGTPGVGTSYNLWAEVIADAAGFELLHVPYKGEAPALVDLVGGQLQFMVVTGAAKAHVDAGRLHILATTGPERWNVFPNAPTLRESGVDALVASGWLAFIAPAGIPKDIQEKLNTAFVQALKSPAVENALAGQGYTIVASKPEELASLIQSETALFGKIIKSGRVKLQ